MDDKGYAFTPLSLLIIIPVLVIAISYGNIINEANLIGSLITGGDVTTTAAASIITTTQKGAGDAGRNAAYNATREVIDHRAFFASGTSKNNITNNIINGLNSNIVNVTLELERQTGRQIYINNVPINSYSDKPFNSTNVYITQNDPFGFTVNIQGGIPIRIVQPDNDQSYEFHTPNTSKYVSIEGLEDPYAWLYTKYRTSNVIYRYEQFDDRTGQQLYYFDQMDSKNPAEIHFLAECLNGTDNPSWISPRPLYFPDAGGLSFFDRLEGKLTSTEPNNVRMGSFIIGDPLMEDHGGPEISRVDHEYIRAIPATYRIKIGGDFMVDPLGSYVYLSQDYAVNIFKIKSTYLSGV